MKKKYLNKIIELAKTSYNLDEIPVGAIVVKNNTIIGEGINSRENGNSITGHAEINAIDMACKNIGDWRLDDCVMYVTLSPCMMCTGAIVDSRIKKVYYLCDRTNVCFNNSSFILTEKIIDEEKLHEYMELLKLFFENKRK